MHSAILSVIMRNLMGNIISLITPIILWMNTEEIIPYMINTLSYLYKMSFNSILCSNGIYIFFSA